MIQAIGIVVEVIVAVLLAGVLFLLETSTNLAPRRNFKRAINRVRHNVQDHRLD